MRKISFSGGPGFIRTVLGAILCSVFVFGFFWGMSFYCVLFGFGPEVCGL